MKVWLLRHGRTAYNREQRYQGLRDIPLSPEGEALAGDYKALEYYERNTFAYSAINGKD